MRIGRCERRLDWKASGTVEKVLVFLLTVLASCQSTKPLPAEDRFAKADTNHDGKLSPDEASDYFVGQIFESRDSNHDGKLSWQEWNVPGADRCRSKFEAADTDKDGSLSLDAGEPPFAQLKEQAHINPAARCE